MAIGCATPSGTDDAPVTDSEILPVDPDVTVGTLENGLRYYIRRNTEPRQRAYLRLAVDAGSILEDEDQLGLAHFLEHMAFNGTASYSGNEIIAFLERLGIQFGPDVNAYTSFDETVYELSVPTDSRETFDEAMQVLLEWASAITLDPGEIEKERGVIVEEWRFRRGAAARMRDTQFPVLFGDSRYATRLPIGDVELIQTFEPEVLERFYADWYRPDLMAIVAVGDFDPAEVEAQIIDLFGTLANPDGSRERETFTVPDHSDTRFVIAADPENPYTTVSVYVKRDAEELRGTDDYRRLIMGRLFTSMINARFDEITREPDAPFLGAGVSSGSLVRSKAAATISAAVQGNEVVPALQALVTEVRRVQEFGFTATELERAKANQLRSIEQTFRERANINSESFADEYVRAFLQNEAIPGIPFERELQEQLVPGITLDEINQLGELYLEDENRVVVVSAIEREDLPAVVTAELEEAFSIAMDAEIDPYEDAEVAESLLPALPEAGSITGRAELDAEGAVELTLSNGVRVVYMPTDYRADQILMSAFRSGGSSTTDAFRSAEYATVFTEQMGYGELSAADLGRVLAGRALSVSPFVSTYEEGFSGSASVEDLETMLELLHLKMTAPRRDEGVYQALMNQFGAIVANQENQPQYQLNRRFSELYNDGNARTLPIATENVSELDLDELLSFHRDRFGNADGFTFVFVGTISEATFLPLVEQYIASLPAAPGQGGWNDVGVGRPDGVRTDTIRFGIEPISEVVLAFFGPYEFSQRTNYQIRALERMLSARMQEAIREDESGTYGVGVQAQFTRQPFDRYGVLLTFRADPARIGDLTSIVFSVIEELKQDGAADAYVERVQETQRVGFEEQLTSNQFWLGQLAYVLRHDRPVAAIREYLTLVDQLDAEQLQDSAANYLDLDRYVQVTLLPEDE